MTTRQIVISSQNPVNGIVDIDIPDTGFVRKIVLLSMTFTTSAPEPLIENAIALTWTNTSWSMGYQTDAYAHIDYDSVAQRGHTEYYHPILLYADTTKTQKEVLRVPNIKLSDWVNRDALTTIDKVILRLGIQYDDALYYPSLVTGEGFVQRRNVV